MSLRLVLVLLLALATPASSQQGLNFPGGPGPAGATGAQGAAGAMGATGATGSAGATGAAGGFSAFGQPSSRTFALGSAYQCSDNTKPCIFTVTLTSSASFSLLSGVTNTADVVIGTTAGVATSGGVVIGKYSNSLTSSLAIGINTATVANTTYVLHMPTGAFMALRSTGGGTVTVVNSSVEQTVS